MRQLVSIAENDLIYCSKIMKHWIYNCILLILLQRCRWYYPASKCVAACTTPLTFRESWSRIFQNSEEDLGKNSYELFTWNCVYVCVSECVCACMPMYLGDQCFHFYVFHCFYTKYLFCCSHTNPSLGHVLSCAGLHTTLLVIFLLFLRINMTVSYVTLTKMSIVHVILYVWYCDRPILVDSQC